METEEQERNRKQRKDLYGIMETGNRKDGIERHPTAYFGDPGAIVHLNTGCYNNLDAEPVYERRGVFERRNGSFTGNCKQGRCG